MKNQLIIRPVITEKGDNLSSKSNKYSFVVQKDVNKIQIRKTVEATYNVNVLDVNTMIVPGKRKVRSTKAGILKGIKPGYKKAIVTLAPGDEITIFADDQK
ncbi:MAG TPA: 50S ribosomal protein L23 [Saprospiraceae bacterium]|jgi:large subunit ribosomal protein L23|nr:50S ribosomal protein L23 [Saprospiraceae bacterium]HUN15694.1 50S ribosomal protein L23 [Saprospiraceae bacterium]